MGSRKLHEAIMVSIAAADVNSRVHLHQVQGYTRLFVEHGADIARSHRQDVVATIDAKLANMTTSRGKCYLGFVHALHELRVHLERRQRTDDAGQSKAKPTVAASAEEAPYIGVNG